ncbi:MAG: T9SS type A sorting domain-containing protein [Muribaculaceae bacterium]|nr:T9SS type A sorting domain-containing protein [Muribaculaceae bacterium]
MKKLLLAAIVSVVASSAFAELPADGYYRVQNAYTKRYAYLLDNKGSINIGGTTVDVGALKMYLDVTNLNTDPADIFYIDHHTDNPNKYDISGQGTSVYAFIGQYVDIVESRKQYEGRDAYMLYGTDSGMVKYIGDIWLNMSDNEGMSSSEAKGDDRKWYLNPVDAKTDQYFGIAPSQTAQGKYYGSLYAGFPYSAYSEGVKFYTITEIDPRGAAIISEVYGTVPAGTPVIVECANPLATDNRLNVGPASYSGTVSGNLLKGVYFDNPSGSHYNRTRFDRETMRVLGVKNGHLAFVEGDYDFIPRNQAYLQLTDPSQYAVKDFIVMTAEQRDNELGVVASIPVSASVDVYSLDGRLVESGIAREDVSSLGKGIYILRSAGATEKLIVR